jgi:argininosuccinate synthase
VLRNVKGTADRLVLVYPGDHDFSASIPALKSRHGADVITMTLDLGQGKALEQVRDRALALGALRAHVLDVRDEFAGDFILPALKADAVYEDASPLMTALVPMLTACKLVEIAGIERATLVALDSGGTLAEQARLKTAIRTLNPALKIVAASAAETAGTDRFESASGAARPTAHPLDPATVAITFERGVPVAINSVNMSFPDLMGSFGTIASAHGVTTPLVLLHAAHRGLQKLVVAPELDRFSDVVGRQYAELTDDGLWFTPLRQALDGFVQRVQERVTGVVRLELLDGRCRIVAVESSNALDLASQDEEVAVGDALA